LHLIDLKRQQVGHLLVRLLQLLLRLAAHAAAADSPARPGINAIKLLGAYRILQRSELKEVLQRYSKLVPRIDIDRHSKPG
jgi:hypothetical protein